MLTTKKGEFLLKSKEHVQKDCESNFSAEDFEKIKNNIKFQHDKKEHFDQVVGNKYLEVHNHRNLIRWVLIGFVVGFIILALLPLLNVGSSDYWGEVESNATYFYALVVSAAFLFFSTAFDYSLHEKYVYDFYYDGYSNILKKHIEESKKTKEQTKVRIQIENDTKISSADHTLPKESN